MQCTRGRWMALATILAALSGGWDHEAGAVPVFVEELQFGEGSTIPVAWADADGDGDLDLAVGNFFNEPNFLYFNGGDGTFTEEARFGQKNTFALAWGDFDNDGDRDMAVGNDGLRNRLIVNNGDGTFSGQSQFGVHRTIAYAWGDYDNDGDLDMAVGNGILGTIEQNYLYVNNGDGTWTEEAQFGTGQTGSLTWGDYDDDGDLDLAVGNGGFIAVGQNYLYVNNGDGTFTEEAQFGMGDTSCLVWGDCENDGDLDLAVANWNAGQNYLYVNNGDGTFTEVAAFGVRDPNTMAWGDCDNDGDLDLAVGNGDFDGADLNYLYENDGTGTFTESAQFGVGSTDAVAWGDYDGDGDLDLAVGNEHTPKTNYLYVNQENDSDYLSVHLVGRFHDSGAGHSNRDGVGAKVLVYEPGFLGDPAHLLGFREISAHGGFAAQNSIEAHFGVPGQSSVDVRIVWPGSAGSNIVQDLTDVAVPGSYLIDEVAGIPTSSPSLGSAGVPGWRIVPNPTQDTVTIGLARGRLGETARFDIFDAAGRRVRTLDASEDSEGTLEAQWNGRSRNGVPVSSGVYFVRLSGEKLGAPGRIVVTR